jgi:ABC-2 type transport system permease protein
MTAFSSDEVYDSNVKDTPVIGTIKAVYKRRGLLRLLVARDLTVRYKRSVLGIWWSLLNPIVTSAILYYVFNTVFKAKMASGTSFAPYLLSGMLISTFFNQGLTMAADAVAGGAGVLTKVYVPPPIFALSATISSAVNFFMGLIPLTFVVYISGQTLRVRTPAVIIVALCMILLTTGLGLLISVVYIRFDDSRSLVQLGLLMLTYMTPIFYPISVLGPHTRDVIVLNPLTSFLNVFRDMFGGNAVASLGDWLYMSGSSVVLFLLGLYFFNRIWPKTVAML